MIYTCICINGYRISQYIAKKTVVENGTENVICNLNLNFKRSACILSSGISITALSHSVTAKWIATITTNQNDRCHRAPLKIEMHTAASTRFPWFPFKLVETISVHKIALFYILSLYLSVYLSQYSTFPSYSTCKMVEMGFCAQGLFRRKPFFLVWIKYYVDYA